MPVHGRVGAKAFTFFPFLKSAARPRSGQCRRAKKEGVWGKEFLPACSASRRRATSGKCFRRLALSQTSKQNSFQSLLKEKIRRAQNKKCEENFFAGWRASASGGAERQSSQSGFSSKKVRILTKRYRQLWELNIHNFFTLTSKRNPE